MTIDQREQEGKQIAEKPDQIKRIDENWYQVKSQSLSYDSWYDVISTEKGFVCICPDHKWRKAKCKHIFAVEFSQKIIGCQKVAIMQWFVGVSVTSLYICISIKVI